jgi:hypothetical protein
MTFGDKTRPAAETFPPRGSWKDRPPVGVLGGMPRPMWKLPATAVLCAAACAVAPPVAGATPTRSCRSADLRYPFEPGGPNAFGVFGLRIANGQCATAHRVAEAWMHMFEAAFRAGHTVLPGAVAGFRFTTLPAHEAQEYRERGRSGATTIWFDYRIPNG